MRNAKFVLARDIRDFTRELEKYDFDIQNFVYTYSTFHVAGYKTNSVIYATPLYKEHANFNEINDYLISHNIQVVLIHEMKNRLNQKRIDAVNEINKRKRDGR